MIYQILFNYESPLQGNGQISKICECKKIADERTVQKKKEKKKERKKWNCRELNSPLWRRNWPGNFIETKYRNFHRNIIFQRSKGASE